MSDDEELRKEKAILSEKSIKYEEALVLLKYESTKRDGRQILEELVSGVEKDFEEALRLYKSSADAGEVRAIDWLNQDVYKRLKALRELLRLIEVGASCFNHYRVGYDVT